MLHENLITFLDNLLPTYFYLFIFALFAYVYIFLLALFIL